MSDIPYMRVFVRDHLALTQHLSAEELGAYDRLLFSMWARGGSIPDDDRDNARIAGLTGPKWARVKVRLMPLFERLANGELTENRLQNEYKNAQETRDKQSQKARKRWGSDSNENSDLADAEAVIRARQSPPTLTPAPTLAREQEEQKEQGTKQQASSRVAARGDSGQTPAAGFQDEDSGIDKPVTKQPPSRNVDSAQDSSAGGEASAEWQARQEEARAAANAARSKAAKAQIAGQERDQSGRVKPGPPTDSGDTRRDRAAERERESATTKAKESRTNRGAMERMDRFASQLDPPMGRDPDEHEIDAVIESLVPEIEATVERYGWSMGNAKHQTLWIGLREIARLIHRDGYDRSLCIAGIARFAQKIPEPPRTLRSALGTIQEFHSKAQPENRP